MFSSRRGSRSHKMSRYRCWHAAWRAGDAVSVLSGLAKPRRWGSTRALYKEEPTVCFKHIVFLLQAALARLHPLLTDSYNSPPHNPYDQLPTATQLVSPHLPTAANPPALKRQSTNANNRNNARLHGLPTLGHRRLCVDLGPRLGKDPQLAVLGWIPARHSAR